MASRLNDNVRAICRLAPSSSRSGVKHQPGRALFRQFVLEVAIMVSRTLIIAWVQAAGWSAGGSLITSRVRRAVYGVRRRVVRDNM
ncbi:hypothetical protein KCP71_10480 [Salmonella enterica subsp. enterica]|nr:hypothetical protein KCP71_10480 [Salmonella enterica subsp. enterica]